ncbi:hypothetical protein [Massilia sp. TSP1-1-2]|uniref:hypothetical protein n=1 Tax=unclassified Massilia TaxID=2609279 RepID=UPI003CEA55A6
MVKRDSPDDNAGANAQADIAALTPQGAARRRVAGLGVSGVLMTVASSGAMAQVVCKSPSGALSGNLNSHAPELTCAGAKPDWWAKHLPSNVKANTKFYKLFPTNDKVGNMNLSTVLAERAHNGTASVPALILATWFNVTVSPPKVTVMTAQAVKDMWANYDRNNPFYRPGNGSQVWTSEQLADYLRSTQY